MHKRKFLLDKQQIADTITRLLFIKLRKTKIDSNHSWKIYKCWNQLLDWYGTLTQNILFTIRNIKYRRHAIFASLLFCMQFFGIYKRSCDFFFSFYYVRFMLTLSGWINHLSRHSRWSRYYTNLTVLSNMSTNLLIDFEWIIFQPWNKSSLGK